MLFPKILFPPLTVSDLPIQPMCWMRHTVPVEAAYQLWSVSKVLSMEKVCTHIESSLCPKKVWNKTEILQHDVFKTGGESSEFFPTSLWILYGYFSNLSKCIQGFWDISFVPNPHFPPHLYVSPFPFPGPSPFPVPVPWQFYSLALTEWPIRGQHKGHMTSFDESEASYSKSSLLG